MWTKLGAVLLVGAIVTGRPDAGLGQAVKATVATAALQPSSAQEWTRDLGYGATELQPLRLNGLGMPLVRAQVDGVDLWLLFDFGTSRGFVLTTHAPPVPQREEDRVQETNADGSPRGESIRIRVDSIVALGRVFRDEVGTLADWKLFSTEPFDGTLGLDFVRGRRVTLDYASGLIGVSAQALPDSLDYRRYVSVDLVPAPASQGQIVYARARVNGRAALVYIDTGNNVSWIDPAFTDGLTRVERPGRYTTFREHVPLELGGRTFFLDDVREAPIRRGPGLDLPVALTLGSDVLSHFVVTVDKRAGKLVLAVPSVGR